MIVLDENFPESQRLLLRSWRIRFRQVGYEIGPRGIKDDDIITLLLQLRRPTFFSLDFHFYKRKQCHAQYCLIYLDVWQYEAAAFVRRLLHHERFDTSAKRMGSIVRVSQVGLSVWQLHATEENLFSWD